ncbi:hypothetical protein GN244_ATG05890 [Phytophthora infestans]|uniref:Uncharacterized protein n=1 Tax=Phytophthora infestans TaxID=4787 RepID=A0A833W4C5_PHYIN|nr:hypothetical protein GN244_ATG05890 [Phytophthora infestans]KAF4130503.1 hypothetical protein GN958_ATG20305 [Phytophthora infestans]
MAATMQLTKDSMVERRCICVGLSELENGFGWCAQGTRKRPYTVIMIMLVRVVVLVYGVK